MRMMKAQHGRPQGESLLPHIGAKQNGWSIFQWMWVPPQNGRIYKVLLTAILLSLLQQLDSLVLSKIISCLDWPFGQDRICAASPGMMLTLLR